MANRAAKLHPQADSIAQQPLELVYSDLVGPLDEKSAGGNRYILSAIDDFSGFAVVAA
jgi:hypothetical protein